MAQILYVANAKMMVTTKRTPSKSLLPSFPKQRGVGTPQWGGKITYHGVLYYTWVAFTLWQWRRLTEHSATVVARHRGCHMPPTACEGGAPGCRNVETLQV